MLLSGLHRVSSVSNSGFSRIMSQVGLSARRANSFMGLFNDSLGVISSSCNVAIQCASHRNPSFGDSKMGARLSTVSSVLSDTSGILGMSRSCALWTRLLTGELLWDVDDKGDWIAVDVENSKELEANEENKVLEKKDNQDNKVTCRRKVWRSPFAIASDVSLLAARTCSGISFLEDKGMYSLGRHSGSLGVKTATFSLFMASSAFSAVNLSIGLVKDLQRPSAPSLRQAGVFNLERNRINVQQREARERALRNSLRCRCYELFCDVVDLVVTPIDFSIWVLGGVYSAVIGSVLLLISSLLNFFRNFV